jgi:3-deoxy-D-manno-octulosonic-acid transferase
LYWLLYDIVIRIFGFLIRVSSLFLKKSKLWVEGRKDWILNLPEVEDCILFHVASLGEFEQARPLIEMIHFHSSEHKVVLSFFSPSGYEIRKDFGLVDQVIYLPLDTKKNARSLLKRLKPRAIIFTKYDLWFNLIREADRLHCPIYLISASFRKHQFYFTPFGVPLKRLLLKFKMIWTLDESTYDLLKSKGFKNVSRSGDTRIDRVLKLKDETHDSAAIISFIKGRKMFIAGSTWAKDEAILFPTILNVLPNDWCIVIAPHEVHQSHLEDLKQKIESQSILYSRLESEMINSRVLIVDSIGHLSHLYKHAQMAYIGGGFGKGIHNTLEPASAGIPVLFGPKYNKFIEATEMINRGLSFEISSQESLARTVENLLNTELRQDISEKLKAFLKESAGSTEIIFNQLRIDQIIDNSTDE